MSGREIRCPHCGLECEVAMDHAPDIVVLTCPGCSTPLVLYHGQTFAIDQAELTYLKRQGHVREAQGWVRPSEASKSPVEPTAPVAGVDSGPTSRGIDRPAKVIDEDSILNLRIDLQRCETVDDFLKLLG